MTDEMKQFKLTRKEALRLIGYSAMGTQAGVLGMTSVGCAALPQMTDNAAKEPSGPFPGLSNLKGEPVKAPDINGRITIIDFWASWCAPCRQGFKYLDQLFQTYTGHGLNVLAISVDTDLEAARRFHARMRPRFPVFWDKKGRIKEQFRVQGLPTSILLNENARVIHRYEGFDKRSHQLLVAHVRRLLQGI